MNAFDAIALVAEEKIREAERNGAFENLPGAGKPLRLEDDSHIAPELRMAYTILKNSGHLEPETGPRVPGVPTTRLRLAEEEGHAHNRLTRFNVRMGRLRRAQGKNPAGLLQAGFEQTPYLERLLEKLSG